MKRRKYIENKWSYWLNDIFLRKKNIRISPDLVLESMYDFNYKQHNIYEFYTEYKINDYAIGKLSIYVHNKCNCLNFTGIKANIPTNKFSLEVYVEKIVFDLKKLINKLISLNPLILTSRIVINLQSININKYYNSFHFLCLFKEQLKKEGWVYNSSREYYFP